MFELFGEMDSCEELNETAAGLLAEGDVKNIRILAEENGLDPELTEMYIKGELPELTDAVTAALGKIEVEAADLQPQEILLDWIDYIRGCAGKEEEMARAVRKKGKSVKACIATLLTWALQHRYPVDKDILKAAGVNMRVELGEPGSATAKKLIRDYYLGGGRKK